MNTDPQSINPSYEAILEKSINDKEDAQKELVNSVITLFRNNQDTIKNLVTRFGNNLYNLDGNTIIVAGDSSRLRICFTSLFSPAGNEILFDFSNSKFMITDKLSNSEKFTSAKETIMLLSDEYCFNSAISIANPNELLLVSSHKNNEFLSKMNTRLSIFNN